MAYPYDPDEFDLCVMRAKAKFANSRLQDADESITSLMVWHCGKFDVDIIERFTSLRSLRVAGWYGSSLDALRAMPSLEHLFIYMLPNVTSFDALSELSGLRHVELSVNHWNDMQSIDSFEPIGDHQHLQYVRLTGLSPIDKNLVCLLNNPSLTKLELADVFPLEELAKAIQLRPDLAEYFEPIVCEDIKCNKCKAHKVSLRGLSGSRRMRLLCPECNHKRVKCHQAEFEALLVGN